MQNKSAFFKTVFVQTVLKKSHQKISNLPETNIFEPEKDASQYASPFPGVFQVLR